ncbi:Uncharacterised protein [Serratia fonticola]|uniref:Uncharacterized protein n=1 Tax=Serratia fonticola TaxID=47917 RepID=A0A4U9VFB4_SERFO|nr:Uncharacterised protein [Serratia fonticola]
MLANTSGGSARSPVNGLPGARRIIKKEMVIRINSVGIASSRRRKINLSIALALCFSLITAYCLEMGRRPVPPALAASMFDDVQVFVVNVIKWIFA